MNNLPKHIEEKIDEHLRALKLESMNWISGDTFIEEWKEKEMFLYCNSFLEIKLNNGDRIDFSYTQSPENEICLCDENNQDYDPIHNCCGINCDWEIPIVIKHSPNGTEEVFVFSGEQKDLWE